MTRNRTAKKKENRVEHCVILDIAMLEAALLADYVIVSRSNIFFGRHWITSVSGAIKKL
jgi:hypothetical protein